MQFTLFYNVEIPKLFSIRLFCMKILMAVTNDIATDQRVGRSCSTLTEAGHSVTLVGRRLPKSPPLGVKPYKTNRMRLLFKRSALFYAEYNFRLALWLLVHPADLIYANDTDTLLACTLVARLRHKRLAFDAHELFPDVPELVGRTRVQSVWRWVERKCLPHVDVAVTVCQSLADEYHRRYGIAMTVVRNVAERNMVPQGTSPVAPSNKTTPPIILYQGAVNVGRGVQELIDALQYLPEAKLIVAGNGDLLQTLRHYAATKAWGRRVEFCGRMLPEQLHELTRSVDLGVCLLEDLGLNYRYALPNRVADFIHAGVPLLATDFFEIRHIVEQYGTGTLFEPCPAEKSGENYSDYIHRLAATIRRAIDYWRSLPADEYLNRFEHARKELCWEKEKKQLLCAINRIL